MRRLSRLKRFGKWFVAALALVALLSAGTRFAPYRPRSDVPALGWYADAWRLWVRTEDGQIGEISLEGNPLRWARD